MIFLSEVLAVVCSVHAYVGMSFEGCLSCRAAVKFSLALITG